MKLLKPFLPSLYSEYLLTQPAFLLTHSLPKIDLIQLGSDHPTSSSTLTGEEKNAHSPAADARGPGGDGKGTYERGLGETFGYPGDAKKLRERSKIKLWREYFVMHGRGLTCEYLFPRCGKLELVSVKYGGAFCIVLRYPPFQRLLQVGLPSRLRGELWETLSGSICTSPPSLLVIHYSSSPVRTHNRPTLRKPNDLHPPPERKRQSSYLRDGRDREGSE
jgi:hypothetical protein